MKTDKLKEVFLGITDPLFYPDIAEARRVSNQLLKAAQAQNPGVTLRIDERWRNQIVRRELRFSLVTSFRWFENMASQINSLVSQRDRRGIQRAMDYLARQGSVIN